MNTDLDIDGEFDALQTRKAKLLLLQKLRQEVGELEITAATASRDAIATLKIVCDEVCRHFNVTMEILGRKSREQSIAMPRQIVFYLSREFSDITLQSIGNAFRKNHGTVMHGCRKVRNRIQTDTRFAAALENLRSTVESRLKKAAKDEQGIETNEPHLD